MADKLLEKFQKEEDASAYRNRSGRIVTHRYDDQGNVISRRVRLLCEDPSKTEKSHALYTKPSDIIEKFDTTDILRSIGKMDKLDDRVLDVPSQTFKESLDLVKAAESNFEKLPPNIRNRFQGKPYELIKFLDNPTDAQKEEAYDLGILVRPKPPQPPIPDPVPEPSPAPEPT